MTGLYSNKDNHLLYRNATFTTTLAYLATILSPVLNDPEVISVKQKNVQPESSNLRPNVLMLGLCAKGYTSEIFTNFTEK